jgi:hypothetical protein
MKELKATVSDEEFHDLEQVAKAQGATRGGNCASECGGLSRKGQSRISV